MILSANNISKSFGEVNIINNASFIINDNEKVAITGINGAGKTTLLKILTQPQTADSGNIVLAKDKKIGYLKQINNIETGSNMLDELYTVIQPILDMEKNLLAMQEKMKFLNGEELEKLYEAYTSLNHKYELLDGYSAKSRVVGILKGLGFLEEDFTKPLDTLSGGQKTRVFLAKLLLESPDIIFLDEPTNHLDLSSIEWLETYLVNYKGAVVIVSHDRYFLDKVVNKIIDIDNTAVTTYTGNYTDFSAKKIMLLEARQKAYEDQQREIKHQEAVIEKLRSFNREKSVKRANSRQKNLDKIERLSAPVNIKTDMDLNFNTDILSGKDVLSVSNLSKSFDKLNLFSGLNFEVYRGERLAILGDNGTGKTTILKILTGNLSADSGDITFGSNVFMAYYDQEQQLLSPDNSIFDELSYTYKNMTNTEVRNVLAAFLFRGDEVYKKISDLSGGERARVALAKLMLSKANLLILDEPTNHLDIISKEVLEKNINSFPGTVIYVSHDRYFINKTASRILYLTEKRLDNYIGNYDYYLEKRAAVEEAGKKLNYANYNAINNLNIIDIAAKSKHETDFIDNAKYMNSDSDKSNLNDNTDSKTTWLAKKEEQAKLKKIKNRLAKCEDEIHKLELLLEDIDKEFSKTENQTNTSLLIELQAKKDELQNNLEPLYEEWEELASYEG